MHLPDEVAEKIRSDARNYNKVKVVLKRKRYFIESEELELLQVRLPRATGAW